MSDESEYDVVVWPLNRSCTIYFYIKFHIVLGHTPPYPAVQNNFHFTCCKAAKAKERSDNREFTAAGSLLYGVEKGRGITGGC